MMLKPMKKNNGYELLTEPLPRKMEQYKVTGDMLTGMLGIKGIIVNIEYDASRGILHLYAWNESANPVLEGQEIPTKVPVKE